MGGVPYWNRDAFAKAAERLRAKGHTVYNPHEADFTKYGTDITNPLGSITIAEVDYNFSRRDAIADGLQYICRNAEAIALLPGWEHSTGAFAEWATTKAIDLKFIYNP
jgi:dTDP-4-amino-4,6-dideoxygalactose transaminase